MNEKLKIGFDTEKVVLALTRAIDEIETSTQVSEFGFVKAISNGIATIIGMSKVSLDEVVEFQNGSIGIVRELKKNEVKAVLFNNVDEVKEGHRVLRKMTDLKIPVSKKIIGRVLNVFGEPIDDLGPILHGEDLEYVPVESEAPRLSEREPVSEPLITGTIAIDSMIPIGLGQRELILGDMQTGKTSLAVNAIINQKNRQKGPIYCFYVSVGQKMDKVIEVYNMLKESGAMQYTTIIVSSASDSAHTQFISPYAGCSMSEFFMRKGCDCLIVYDDLSKHAVAHREISRLLGRPAGRDAFPADAFYVHARLLERSARLNKGAGGGSMTALPIIETQESDISGYIPTNVISITDGQVFLDQREFDTQQRPAIDVGLSVSRIGSAAQADVTKMVSRSMRVELAQYKELVRLLQYSGGDLDRTQIRILQKGKQTKALILQDVDEVYSLQEQAVLAIGAHNGIFDKVLEDRKKIRMVKKNFLEVVAKECNKIMERLSSYGSISDKDLEILKNLAHKFGEEV